MCYFTVKVQKKNSTIKAAVIEKAKIYCDNLNCSIYKITRTGTYNALIKALESMGDQKIADRVYDIKYMS